MEENIEGQGQDIFSREKPKPIENQVVDKSQLVVGEKYVFRVGDVKRDPLEITKAPYKIQGETGWFINVVATVEGEIIEALMNTFDLGIDPSEDGYWSTQGRLIAQDPQILDRNVVSLKDFRKIKKD